MTVVADEKKCVHLPDAQPGDRFEVQAAGEGKILLTRLDSGTTFGERFSSAEEAKRRSETRDQLVRVLKGSDAIVGEKPTRDRTYSDRRFHRH